MTTTTPLLKAHPPSRRVLTVALAFGAGTALGVAGMALISRDHAVTRVPRRGVRSRGAVGCPARQHHRHRPPRPADAQRQPRSPDTCRNKAASPPSTTATN